MKRPAHGFTIVELVTVMVVIGILAAIAIPRIAQTDTFTANAYRNEVASALRHAQKSAVSHRRMVCVSVAETTVNLMIASQANIPCTAMYTSPNGTQYASRDATIKASGTFVNNSGSPTLYFHPNGDITTDSAGTAFAVGTITITGQPALAIDGRTGYVE